jgi:hypothetical protein
VAIDLKKNEQELDRSVIWFCPIFFAIALRKARDIQHQVFPEVALFILPRGA